MILQDLINRLTTRFRKDKDSNNYKLMKILFEQLKLIEDNFNRQFDWMDISKAEGYALDQIGIRVGLPRGTMSDEMYRVRIRIQIARNLSKGTINDVIEILSSALNTTVNNVHVDTLWENGQPDTIIIRDIPITTLNNAGITQNELIEMTRQIVAAGIKVESINLTGTYRLGAIINDVETNSQYGLSDVGMTVGGKLGAVLSLN